MLAIVDYGAGNQTSVARALDSLGLDCEITASPERLRASRGIIFPGVGAAGQAMAALAATGLDEALRHAAGRGQPILGICVGCQIMLEKSEEGDTPTLGLVQGQCRRFPAPEPGPPPARVPHMGWNSLQIVRQDPLLDGIPPGAEFYFVHSYYPVPAGDLAIARTSHGLDFCSLYGRPGLWGAQFHPEKSGRWGLRLLANFHRYCQESSPC